MLSRPILSYQKARPFTHPPAQGSQTPGLLWAYSPHSFSVSKLLWVKKRHLSEPEIWTWQMSLEAIAHTTQLPAQLGKGSVGMFA